MTPHPLLGSRVELLVWDDLRDVLPVGPVGTVTHVCGSGEDGVQVKVQVDGLGKEYTFEVDEVRILQGSPVVASATGWR